MKIMKANTEMKMGQLKEIAKEVGVQWKIGMTKETLVELINATTPADGVEVEPIDQMTTEEVEQVEEENIEPKKKPANTKSARTENEELLESLKQDVEVINVLESSVSKSEKIRYLLSEGLAKAIVAKLVDVRYQFVHNVAKNEEKKAG